MAKKKKEEVNTEETPKKTRTRSAKYSKTKGNAYETKIAKELRELGFEGVLTARFESKSKDNNKIDIVDTEGKLPVYIQLKCTQNTPSYFKIEEECDLKDKPFCLIWNKQEKKEVNICSVGEVVMIPKSYFYELLQRVYIE